MSLTVLYANPEGDALDDIVDAERYPVGGSADGIDRVGWDEAVEAARTALAEHGCATLRGFLGPAGLGQARSEIESIVPRALIRSEISNVYARADAEKDLDPDDPRRIQLSRRIGHLTRDQIPPDTVRTLQMHAGDLQIFLGRYSLHRVTEVRGNTTRCVGVLGYANRPGVIGPFDRTRSVYGRVTEAHLLAAEFAPKSGDGLIL